MFVNYIPVAIKSEIMFGESFDRHSMSDRLELGFGEGMDGWMDNWIENKKLSDNLRSFYPLTLYHTKVGKTCG